MSENKKLWLFVLLKIGIVLVIMGLLIALYSYNRTNNQVNPNNSVSK